MTDSGEGRVETVTTSDLVNMAEEVAEQPTLKLVQARPTSPLWARS